MSVRMRHTKGHTGNRRSHHALKEPRLSTCSECKTLHVRHQICMKCGTYRGRKVIDAIGMQERRDRRKEAKERAIGEVTGKQAQESEEKQEADVAEADESKPLSAEELSKK